VGFAVDVASIGAGAAHEALDKASGACAIYEEVGVAEFDANVNARWFGAVNGVGWGM
jgi:hypothetical protein